MGVVMATVVSDAGRALAGCVPHVPEANDKSSKAISPYTVPPTIPSNNIYKKKIHIIKT